MQYRQSGNFTFRSFVYHKNAFRLFDDMADRRMDGYGIISTYAVLSCAAANEACINHVGPHVVGDTWNERVAWWKKIKKLSHYLGFSTEEWPFTEVKVIQEFRDLMMHGKTKNISYVRVVDNADKYHGMTPYLISHYQGDERRKYAIKATEEFITMLMTKSGLDIKEMYIISDGECLTNLA